jgi:hypothetical protein
MELRRFTVEEGVLCEEANLELLGGGKGLLPSCREPSPYIKGEMVKA